jgi:hypothetical protein
MWRAGPESLNLTKSPGRRPADHSAGDHARAATMRQTGALLRPDDPRASIIIHNSNQELPMSAFTDLTQLLEQDRGTPHPKYPEQALYALRDKVVAEAVERRFKGKESLVVIRSLGCHRASGLLHTVFEFSKAGAVALAPNALLVITDSRCRLVGMVDPFDAQQPNPLLPALSGAGELPLALAQPSDADEPIFSPEDLRPREQRTRAYLQNMNVESGSGGPTPRYYAVDTTSVVGYQWRQELYYVSPTGQRKYVWVQHEVNGADDTGVGGDEGITPV